MGQYDTIGSYIECPRCGTKLPLHARFCAVCGNPVSQVPVPAAQPQNPQKETVPPQDESGVFNFFEESVQQEAVPPQDKNGVFNFFEESVQQEQHPEQQNSQEQEPAERESVFPQSGFVSFPSFSESVERGRSEPAVQEPSVQESAGQEPSIQEPAVPQGAFSSIVEPIGRPVQQWQQPEEIQQPQSAFGTFTPFVESVQQEQQPIEQQPIEQEPVRPQGTFPGFGETKVEPTQAFGWSAEPQQPRFPEQQAEQPGVFQPQSAFDPQTGRPVMPQPQSAFQPSVEKPVSQPQQRLDPYTGHPVSNNAQSVQQIIPDPNRRVIPDRTGRPLVQRRKKRVFQPSTSDAPEEIVAQEDAVFAKGLPEWTIEPPVIPVRRRRHG